MTRAGGAGGHVHPTHDDPVVAALSEGVGGPVGPRASRSRWWNPTAVVLALAALTFALGMLQKAPCAASAWADGETRYAAMCYSDLPYLYTGRGMVEHAWPYSDDPQVRERFAVMEYPVGISYWAWGTAWATHAVVGFPDLTERYRTPPDALFGQPEIAREITVYVGLNAVGLALLTLLSAWLLARVNPRRPWDAAIFAASPALALTGLVNWDLLAVVCVAGTLWAWSRGRPVATGVLLGLGAAVKLYPAFLLGGVLVLCVRARRWRELAVVTGTAVLAWALANAPALLTGPEQWRVFWSFNAERAADLGSVWTMLSQALAVRPRLHHQPGLGVVLRALVPRGGRARPRGAPLTAPGPARVPRRGRVPADQQGLLTAVRAVAAAVGRPGPPALARPDHLAGERGLLLRDHLVVPRRLPAPRRRRRRQRRRAGLLGGHRAADARRAVPGRRRRPRRVAPRARPGPERLRAGDGTGRRTSWCSGPARRGRHRRRARRPRAAGTASRPACAAARRRPAAGRRR